MQREFLKSRHLIKVLEAVRRVNRLITHTDKIEEICDGVCEILIESREYFNAWIVLLENGRPAEPFFHKGFGQDFHPMAERLKRGEIPPCVNKSLISNGLIVNHNPFSDCAGCPFDDRYADNIGFSHPLMWSNVLLGWIGVAVPGDFGASEEEQSIFVELVEDMSLAIYNLKSREVNLNLSFNYESLLENSTQGVLILDPAGKIMKSNAYWEELSERLTRDRILSLGETLGDTELVGLKMEEARVKGASEFRVSVDSLVSSRLELKIVFTSNLDDASSNILCLISEATPREAMIKALSESEKKFQLMFENAPLGYQSLDEDGKFITVNKAWMDTLGYNLDDVLGRWFGDFLHPDYVEAFKKRFPEFKRIGKIHSEFYLRHKSGDYRYISFEGKIGRDENNAFKQTHCILSDITEQKKAEMKLVERETFLKNIYNNMPSGVAVYKALEGGADFLVVDLNPVAQKNARVEIDEIRGKKITEVFPSCRDIGLLDAMRKVFTTGEPFHLPTTFYNDGRITEWVENFVSRLPNDQIVVIYNDVTLQKELELEITQARKMESLGRLAGGVAHDLNNLMTPILGYSEFLESSENLNDKEKEYTAQILKAGKSAADVISKLLLFSRKQRVNHAEVSLNMIIREFEKLIRGALQDNIRLNLSLDEGIDNILADSSQIEQILMNLSVNARDAMPEGGVLDIRTGQKEDLVFLEVADTGAGMPPELTSRIFDPFFTTKGETGTGLGLATVYGIVKSHHAQVEVETSPGKGTAFLITFPIFTTGISEKDLRPDGPSSFLYGKKILLVEDDEDIRRLLLEGLSRHGFTVETVDNGRAAYRSLQKSEYDLVITDIIMPELNGITLYEESINLNPDIKFLFMSGYANDYTVQGVNIRSTNQFIQKPFTVQTLLDRIDSIFSGF